MEINKIVTLLKSQNIFNQVGHLNFSFAGVQFDVESRDVVGGVLQEWFGKWLAMNGIKATSPLNTQDWPDFTLADGMHLEVKAFNYDASPAFDIANFDAYTYSLLTHPERLDSKHLVFGYVSKNTNITIKEFWIKQVWEMTGPSPKNFLGLQVRYGVVSNIRPKNWRSKRVKIFNTRDEFVRALAAALTRFYPKRYPNWYNQVSAAYQAKTGNAL